MTEAGGTGIAQAVIIRQATLDDAPALQRYIAELRAEQLPVLLPIERIPMLEEEREFISGLVEHEASALLLAFRGQELVGALNVTYSPPASSKEITLALCQRMGNGSITTASSGVSGTSLPGSSFWRYTTSSELKYR